MGFSKENEEVKEGFELFDGVDVSNFLKDWATKAPRAQWDKDPSGIDWMKHFNKLFKARALPCSGHINDKGNWLFLTGPNAPYDSCTHTGFVLGITEIPVEPCVHQPDFANKIPGWHHGPTSEVICGLCRQPLEAEWREKK